MKIWTCGRITAMRDIGELHGDQGFVMIEDHDAAIASLTNLRALDEQQFAKLKASFDEVVRQRDEYRRALELMAIEWLGDPDALPDFDSGIYQPSVRELAERYIDKARQAGEGESLAQVASDVTCPQCGNPSVKYPSGDSEYCEDCGWPDEDFGEEKK